MTALANAPANALAKINLYLHVIGRRPDGYHQLDSLVAFAEAGDHLNVSPAADLSLEITGSFAPQVPTSADNLVLRAARALAQTQRTPETCGAHMVLDKRLPVAAGLGGGSADAAATLRLLSALWQSELSPSQRHQLAFSLGADVPVCLDSKPAHMGGAGEILAPAPALPRVAVALVNPGVALPTPQVFAARQGDFSAPKPLSETPRDGKHLAALLGQRHNDLEPAACQLAPAISQVLNQLAARDGCLLARMSGSGATCFGLFATTTQANRAATHLQTQNPDWWVTASHLC